MDSYYEAYVKFVLMFGAGFITALVVAIPNFWTISIGVVWFALFAVAMIVPKEI